jgi:phenylalanyl-tRNA synthetase beta chain
MKISYNWLKEYLPIDLPVAEVSAILTDIGLEVGGLEIRGGDQELLEQLVVGHVTEVTKHPDADRLQVTQVDLGNGEPVQIVCGAPNVAQGQKVVVAPVGTTLQPAGGDPFKIKKAKIRGQESQGMICAEDEIGIGTDHDGIIVLEESAETGKGVTNYLHIEADQIFDIDLTPNRSDAMSHLGVARDLAAALSYRQGSTEEVSYPELSPIEPDNNDRPIDVVVEDTDACPRYTSVTLTNVEVKESPDWLKAKLNAIGSRPINNIVDITNFILHEYGQPLHAFDADKIAGNKVIVKKLDAGTKFITLVFGGIKSGVTESTTSIFLESAYFDAGHIRKTSTAHGLKSDAAIRFEKGADPNITLSALTRAVNLMKELAGAKVSSDVGDLYPARIQPAEISLEQSYADTLIGEAVPERDMLQIMELLGIEAQVDNGTYSLRVPPFKADVLRPADAVEEVLRIYGYNKVAVPAHLRTSLSYADKPDPTQINNQVANMLVGSGFYEMMGTSISDSKYYKDLLPTDVVSLINYSAEGMDVMRGSMLFSALEAVRHNLNRQQDIIKGFEFGNTYQGSGTDYQETNHLALVVVGDAQAETWSGKSREAGFFYLKGIVSKIFRQMGLETSEKEETTTSLSEGLTLRMGKEIVAELGLVDGRIAKAMEIKKPVFFADINWTNVMKVAKGQGVTYKPISKFPTVRRDLALVLEGTVTFGQVEQLAWDTAPAILQQVDLFDEYKDEKLGAGKKSYAVSFLFQDESDTLTDKQVDEVMDNLVQAYTDKLKANVRS